MKRIAVTLVALMLALSVPALAAGEPAGRGAAQEDAAGSPNGGGRAEMRDLRPSVRERVSMPAVLLLDLAVPGGGHFYMGNEYTGYTFLALKILGAYSVYYCYHDWKYRRSLYRAARRANAEIDPDHALEFEDPHGGYNTVEEYRRDYDRAAQRITFSVIANVAVYAASLVMTYQAVKKNNDDALPTFELQYSRATLTDGGGMELSMTVTRRF